MLFSPPASFIELKQRGPRDVRRIFSNFTIQRHGDLIVIPHLLAHAVSTLDTGSPTILWGWDTATVSNQQIDIQILVEYTLVCVMVGGSKISLKKVYQPLQ